MLVAVSLFLGNCGAVSPPCGQEWSTGNGDPKAKQDTFNLTPLGPLLARVNERAESLAGKQVVP